MNTYWSSYVQTSEELYASRALRFRADNAPLWLNAIGVSEGMKVLEVGCGGGLFCHRIKAALPGTDVTGLDLDSEHVAFARKKAAELNLNAAFECGDACALPFENESFDLCFSHTVMCFCDPDQFAKEQYRVLKKGGRMTAMDVVNRPNHGEMWLPKDEREKELFDRLWDAAAKNDLNNLKFFSVGKTAWARSMSEAGFKSISFRALAVVSYCPDSIETPRELALAQINENRLSEMSSIEKARRMVASALTDSEFDELRTLINGRYDARIAQYERKETQWDYDTSTVIAISGTK